MTKAIFFDFETGGFDASKDAALELAARVVDLDTGEIVGGSIHTLIKPQGLVGAGAIAVHGIDPVTAEAEGMHNDAVAQQFYDLCRENLVGVLAGHNVSFDIKFLRAMFAKAKSLPPDLRSCAWMPSATLCTLKMANDLKKERRLITPSHKLEKLSEHLGVVLVDAHSAWNDINATIEVYRKLKALNAPKPT